MFNADFSKFFTRFSYNLQNYFFLTLVLDVRKPAIDGQMLQCGDNSVWNIKPFWFPKYIFLALFFQSPDDVSGCKGDSYYLLTCFKEEISHNYSVDLP